MADRQTTYTVSLFGSQQGDDRQDGTSPSRIQQALVDFVMDFHLDNVFIYRFVGCALSTSWWLT
jgi:DNA replication licensing factor MCM5